MFIFTITYNFNRTYVARKSNTKEEAFAAFREHLEEEIKTVKSESGYEPSVLEWYDDDITLVYAEGYSTETRGRNYATEDSAYYRIFEIEEES